MMTRSRIELRRARLRRQGSSSTKITNQQAAFSKVMYKSFKARYIQVLLDIRDIHRGKFTILRTKCTQLRRSFLPNPGHVAAYVCQCYLFVSSKALQTNRALIPRALLAYGVRTRERVFHFTTPQKE